ncbi:protein MET1, chloroplastic [Rutidosis leptorrhynchoides]|uniref:protein MET1, chloroplastic n=1 Tax=Rutidosis leptorrhynchoides TaxID=125765 RepID=UPI003A990857
MSTAPNSYPSLCSSPPLPRTQTFSLITSQFKQTSLKNVKSLKLFIRVGNLSSGKQSVLIVRANGAEEPATEEEDKYEEYEVEIEQPYGLKFAKGRDGGTYIDAIAPGGSADKSNMFSVGDKVIATSAVFGTEMWPAAEYGRTMYTIRQRIGPLLMRMEKRYGKMEEASKLTEKEIIRAERNSGIVSGKLREIQMQNYLRKKEQKETRERELREGLQLYKSGKYEEALEKFESVLGSKPEINEASVASYNVACCYSKLNQIQAGLSALKDALQSDYEDFKRIRSDPDLENLRKSEGFEPLMRQFDESFINENALNAIKSLFGFNKK